MSLVRPFTDPAAIARYVEETPRKVPGLADLHRMAMLLLAERAPGASRILVVGAGGGLELRALAGSRPQWRFVGVDPSAAMLDLARATLGALESRVELIEGLIDSVPLGPFDGATCLLTLHFLSRSDRLETLREIRRRLKSGARLVVAHHSEPPHGELRHWLTRSVAFADISGVDFERASASATEMTNRLPILPVGEDEALLRDAGFAEVALFYAAFSFRGWVASAS